MKKILIILASLTLVVACSQISGDEDNNSYIPPVEEEPTLSGEEAVLVDNDIETVYEAAGANVSLVVPREAEKKVVGYSLYSSGSAIDYDPIDWTLSGSNDGNSWTVVDEQTSYNFFARYQEHLFMLPSEASYTSYKFAFTPRGGDTLRLAEIVLYEKNPNEGWEDFVAPEIRFQLFTSTPAAERVTEATPGVIYYRQLVQDPIRYIQYHCLAVAKLLYFSNDQYNDMCSLFTTNRYIRRITYVLRGNSGVSAKSGSPPTGVSIWFSTNHIVNSYTSSMFKLDFETKGVLFHELTHAYQMEPEGIAGYSEPNTSWQAIEGMADAIRAHARYFPWTNRTRGGNWTDGYQKTGFFLQWLTTKHPDALRKFNESMRNSTPGFEWSFDIGMEAVFGEGARTDDLWSEYQTFLLSL